MTTGATEAADVPQERIQVLLPRSRESELVRRVLGEAGLACQACPGVEALVRSVREGAAGTILLSGRALTPEGARRLREALEAQPVWSDVPVVVLTRERAAHEPVGTELAEAFAGAASVTVLEQPMHPRTLVQALEAARRHRRRQHELRTVLLALRGQARALEDRVEDRTRKVRQLAARLTRAEQAERRRISQLLHDDLQQLLYGIGMRLVMIRSEAKESGAADTGAADTGAADTGTLYEHLETARQWVEQATATTRQLTTELSPAVLENEDLAEALEWLARHMEELHGLEVAVEAEGSHLVEDDDLRTLLFQVTRELLFNVRKHAGVTEATVRLTEEGGHLAVHVIDEGRGFDPDEVDAREVDTHEVDAREDATGGFGLFSVRDRLELMGGRLEIHSALGEGTCITLYASAGDDGRSDEGRSDDERSADGAGDVGAGEPEALNIFTVDDHPVLREMLVALLEHEGDMAICGEAHGGEEALKKIAEAAPGLVPDLVLVDTSLPDMGGIELARRLQKRHPGIALVILSAHTEARYVEQAFEAGVKGYVLKGDAASIPEAVRQVTQGELYVSDRLRHLAPR